MKKILKAGDALVVRHQLKMFLININVFAVKKLILNSTSISHHIVVENVVENQKIIR
jgi:hypothetical protein